MTNVKANHLDLRGQRALVTGASSGIGAGVARGLAAAGASVVLNYVSGKDNAQRIADEIENSGGRAMVIYADVSDEADVQRMFGVIQDRLGGLDILVNNAGLQQDAPIQDMTASRPAPSRRRSIAPPGIRRSTSEIS